VAAEVTDAMPTFEVAGRQPGPDFRSNWQGSVSGYRRPFATGQRGRGSNLATLGKPHIE
jgi:hypothetical protein